MCNCTSGSIKYLYFLYIETFYPLKIVFYLMLKYNAYQNSWITHQFEQSVVILYMIFNNIKNTIWNKCFLIFR